MNLNVDCILRQSVYVNNAPFQQLSNLVLNGISTISGNLNNDNGKLYGSFTYSAPTYTLNIYKDETKLDLVASGTATTIGTIALSEANASGISGTVNLAQYSANDALLDIRVCLSVDDDLPMAQLEGVTDYDPTVGFAEYHLRAFEKIKEIITSRFRSKIYNPLLIDANAINGGLGGFDLSIFNNLHRLRDASRYYAFYLIAERNTVEPGSVFDIRAKEARNMFKAYMESEELTFDETLQRVDTSSRALSTFRTGR